MGFKEHASQFAGFRVIEWEMGQDIPDRSDSFVRVGLTYRDGEQGRWAAKFESFVRSAGVEHLQGIVIGDWHVFADDGGAAPVVEVLAAARERLPGLRVLFLGDITEDEFLPSWIEQADVSPIFAAYPVLERVLIRGSNGLRFRTLQHNHLRSLTVQSSGLPREVVCDILQAELPVLEHLELWLGDSANGGNAIPDDLQPIFAGTAFPKLQYLGLRNAELADEMAIALAGAPILDRLRVLDLSLGMLSDRGAAALVASPAVARLDKLDVHHHYCSHEMVERLRALGISVDVSDSQEEDPIYGSRYVAVSL